jgi:hypothetical protein
VDKAHRLLYHSTLGSRVTKKKKCRVPKTSFIEKSVFPEQIEHVIGNLISGTAFRIWSFGLRVWGLGLLFSG